VFPSVLFYYLGINLCWEYCALRQIFIDIGVWDSHINTCSASKYLPILTKPGGIFQQNFVKLCNTKFHENAPGGLFVTFGQTKLAKLTDVLWTFGFFFCKSSNSCQIWGFLEWQLLKVSDTHISVTNTPTTWLLVVLLRTRGHSQII